jgi:hypothetical protein
MIWFLRLHPQSDRFLQILLELHLNPPLRLDVMQLQVCRLVA